MQNDTTPSAARIKLNVNRHTSIDVSSGTQLLAALKSSGIFIPSACGGRGICGLCKVQVLNGTSLDFSEKEMEHLSAEERHASFRLACQLSLNTDTDIAIPDSYLTAQEYHAEVAAVRNLTHGIRELELRLLSPATISFQAGQYIQLQIPRHGDNKKTVFRPYSIASPPFQSDRIELQVRFHPGGLGSIHVFEHLRPGTRVKFHGPHGNFVLQKTSEKILLVAGGTGMSPIKAILLDMLQKNDQRPVLFFFGARQRQDLLSWETMLRLEKELHRFKFIPTLSSPLPEDNWTGETGLVTEALNRHLAGGTGMDAYISGSPAMIEACLKVLARKGLAGEHVFYDAFARISPARI